MTRDEIQQRILYALNDSTTAPIYWDDAELHSYIQDGQEVLAEEAPYVKRTFYTPRRTGVTIYRLSGINSQMMAPYRLWLPDLKRRLAPVTLAQLDAFYQRWWTSVGEPWWWCALNWDAFLVWLPPTTGEGLLEFDCYCWPEPLLDGHDMPEFLPSSHEALVRYGEVLGKLKQWNAEEMAERLSAFFGEYGQVRSQVTINQVQSRFWVRGDARGGASGRFERY